MVEGEEPSVPGVPPDSDVPEGVVAPVPSGSVSPPVVEAVVRAMGVSTGHG